MVDSLTPEKPKLMKRRQIHVSELRDIVSRQANKLCHDAGKDLTRAACLRWLSEHGVCEYSGEPIKGQPFDLDHKIPNAMLYEGDKIHWEILLRKWHKVKTKADVKDIAKARRLAGETGQYARRKRRGESSIKGRPDGLQSRGFQPKPEGYKYRWGK